MSARASFLLGLAALSIVGCVLRFKGLSFRDFWFDESCSFIYVHDLWHWPAGSNLLAESTNLPYYILLWAWTQAFGDSEGAYRSLSALTAAATVPLIGLIGRRLAGERVGLVAAALAAFHPLHIHYAHEARAYALWVLLLTVTWWLLLRAARGRVGWWAGYGSALLVTLLTHYFTAFWVPASASCAAVADAPRRALRGWLLATGVALLGFGGYFAAAVLPAARGGGQAWIAPHFDPARALGQTLSAFLPAGAYPAHLRGLSLDSADTVRVGHAALTAITQAAPAVMFAGMVLYLALTWVRGRRVVDMAGATGERHDQVGMGFWQSPHVVAAALTLGPLLLAWGYSLVGRPLYLPGRYDLVAWPAFVIWLALIIDTFARRAAQACGGRAAAGPVTAGVTAVLLVCSLVPIVRMDALRPGPSFPRVRAEHVAALAGEGDLVIALSYDRAYLRYYLHRAGFRGEIVSFPGWLDLQVGWLDTSSDLMRRPEVQSEAQAMLTRIDERLTQGSQVLWLEDSLDREGAGPRAGINEVLLETLQHAGLKLTTVDEALGIRQVAADTG